MPRGKLKKYGMALRPGQIFLSPLESKKNKLEDPSYCEMTVKGNETHETFLVLSTYSIKKSKIKKFAHVPTFKKPK